MNSSINCGLEGSYKVDLFSGGKLVKSTDWFDNTITNSGLNYPLVYPFAKCFMFLSLGSGAYGANRQSGVAVASPINSFRVYDSTFTGSAAQPFATGYYDHTGQYIGWEGYEIGGQHNSSFGGSFSSACGTKFTNKGINFYRGWTLPTGAIENGAVLAQDLQINGFMVSPSSGFDPSGHAAFSLVDRSVLIPSGFTATITYQLALSFRDYQNFTYFSGVNDINSGGFFDTGNASTGSNGSDERGLLSGWSKLSGIYRQIVPGLQIVDSLGACVIPAWGDQMEPSYSDCKKLYFYLSPDTSQFAVSQFGSVGVSESGAYNSNGLMANYTQFVSNIGGDLNIYSDHEDSWPSDPNKWYYSGQSQTDASTVQSIFLPANIRMENLLPISNYSGASIPKDTFTYQEKGFVSPIISKQPVAFATPGSLGFDLVNSANYGQRAVYSTYLKRLPTSGLNTPTGSAGVSIRNKKVTKRALFSPIQSMGTNSRYGSLTLAYLSSAGSIGDLTFQPYVDFTFFDNAGKGSDMSHYRIIPDIYLTDRGSGVSQVRFDITGVNSSIPSSINRYYSINGFMGPGVEITPATSSGLDTSNPLFTTPSSAPSGFPFPGQILNQTVSGDYSYNNGTGWGSVYGVIADSDFYSHPLDTCLISYSGWSGPNFNGFSGDFGSASYPNPTGDSSKLFWPTRGSGIGLRITGVAYYLKGYGDYSDPTNFYANSGSDKQMLGDITYGTPSISILSPLSNATNDANFYFSTNPAASVASDLVPVASAFTPSKVIFKNLANTTGFSLPVVTGYDTRFNNTYIAFSGFNYSDLLNSRGSGRNLTSADINGFVISGSALFNTAENYYLVYYDGSTFTSLSDTGMFRAVASKFKKPQGIIHHVENFNGSGNRLLPNYAYPNNQGINYYSPVVGGSYPGLSMENGMQIFMDFNWSGS